MPKSLKPAFLIFLLSALNLLPYLLLYHAGIPDEGLLLYSAKRIASGEFPYRDFFSHIPPLSLFLLAGWLKLLGGSFLAARLLILLCGALIGLLSYLIAREFLPLPYSLLSPICLLAAGVPHWPVISHHWMGVLFLLLGAWLCLLYLKNNSTGLLYLCGIVSSLSFFTMQTEGVALSLGAGIFLLFYGPKNFPKFLLGFLIPSLLIILGLKSANSLPAYLYQNFLWVKESGIPFNLSPFSLKPIIKDCLSFLAALLNLKEFNFALLLWLVNSACYLLVLILKYALFYPVLLILLILHFSRKKTFPLPHFPPAFILILLVLFCWCLSSFYRQDLLYLNYLTPLWYCALAFLLFKGLSAQKAKFFFWLIAGVFLSHNLFSLLETASFRHPVYFPKTVLYCQEAEYAGDINRAVSFLNSQTKADDPIFSYPHNAAFYFLTGRKNPTFFNALWPLISPRNFYFKAKAEIEAAKIPYIFLFPVSPEALNAYPLVDKTLYYREDQLMNRVLLKGYREVEDFNICRVYKRQE